MASTHEIMSNRAVCKAEECFADKNTVLNISHELADVIDEKLEVILRVGRPRNITRTVNKHFSSVLVSEIVEALRREDRTGPSWVMMSIIKQMVKNDFRKYKALFIASDHTVEFQRAVLDARNNGIVINGY